MALDKFRASPLPNPPAQYDPQYIRQMIRVLENYFSQLDSNTPNHAQQYTADTFVGGSFTGTDIVATNSIDTNFLTSHTSVTGYERANGIQTDALISFGHKNGRQISDDMMVGNVYANNFFGNGEHITTPYNQFQSSVTQTAASIANAYAVTYNADDYPDGISVVSNSRITVSHAGVYTIGFSLQFQSTSTSTEQVDIWFRKNGTDVPASNSQFSLPARKSAGIPSSLIAVTNYMTQLEAGDYVEIMWRVTDTVVTMPALAAVTASPGVTPAIPATPSALVIVAFISAKFPNPTYVAPLPVFGFGQIGAISVATR